MGPDFMHPMYTLGFERCLARVAPSVAADLFQTSQGNNIEKNVLQYTILQAFHNTYSPLPTPFLSF